MVTRLRASPDRIERRAARLAAIGAAAARPPQRAGVTRLGLTEEEQRAHALVGGWLERRGARVRSDAAGNLLARFDGKGPSILVGSHLDSVPEGGWYDGALGVVVAAEAMEVLSEAGVRLRSAVEVVGWTDEEGVRFGIGLFGSLAAFGRLPAGAAERRDPSGVTIRQALRALGLSGDPTKARFPKGAVRAYIEPHIEQGPNLAEARKPLAVVSRIVGILHARVTVSGRQDHAGTTPMGDRADAFAGAAEMALALEGIAAQHPDAVGTVGEIAVRPGAKNVVPGECVFSIDIRAPQDRTLDAVVGGFERAVWRIAGARSLRASIDVLNRVEVAPLDRSLRTTLRRACAAAGVEADELVSGAGHDAQNAQLAGVPTGMIFIRSRGGSHSPRERAEPADAALAATALAHALVELAG